MDYEVWENNFEFRLIMPGTWMIGTKCAATPFGCDCYLLEGDTHAILIDSGMSKLNLKEYIDTLALTGKPILGVINTHSHFDHTGGNGFFGHAYLHPKAEKGARTPFGGEDGYILDYAVTYLTEGSTLDLGGRELEIIEIGAHDLGSIAILDKSRRILFTGDELETGWININSMGPDKLPGQTVETHYKNMQKLKARYSEYDVICPAHHGAPIAKESIEHFLTCDKMILDGIPGDPHIPAKNGGGIAFAEKGKARVMRYKSAHICYHIDRIFEDK